MLRLAILVVVLFSIGAFFGFGGVAGLSWAAVAILAAFLMLGALAFLGGTYYRRWAPRPNAVSAVVAGETLRGPYPVPASAAWVTPRLDDGDQSLGRAANRYVTFLIVMTIAFLAIMAVLVFGFIRPSLHTVGETLRENREEFREALRHKPLPARQSIPNPQGPLIYNSDAKP